MNVIFQSVVGSSLHGTRTQGSDIDRRAVYQDTLFDKLSPFRGTTHVHDKETDTTYFELAHFSRMLAKCNPTAVEIAYGSSPTGDVEFVHQLAEAALDTKLYLSRGNGMMFELLRGDTPKRHAHVLRLHSHLTYYADTGKLDYDARNYPTFFEIVGIKNGDEVLDPHRITKVESKNVWHIQDQDKLELLVVNKYSETI